MGNNWGYIKHSVLMPLAGHLVSFWGRDGPRDKTSGHELLFSGLFFVLGWYELRFLSCYQIL